VPRGLDAPVVIIGAGPVGLFTALDLAAQGVESIVVERGIGEVPSEWRGSTLHPPTLEVLDGIGLAGEALTGGIRVDALQHRDLVLNDVITMDFSVLTGHTRFPFRLQYEQYKLLRALRAAAAENSRIDVRYSQNVVDVEPGIDGPWAEVAVRSHDGTDDVVRARWLIAADGSHSTARDALEVGMLGDTYASESLVVALDLPFDEIIVGLTPVSYWTGPHGRLSLIHTPDTWRVAITLDPHGLPSADQATGVHPQLVRAMSLLIGEREWMSQLRQHQRYRSHQRVAASFRVGRALLLGDAAHLSATTGGMGLNSGLHDAHELVSAMAPAILTGEGDEEAAAAFADDRRRVALAHVQPVTRAARTSLDATREIDRQRRLEVLGVIASSPSTMLEHVLTASMFDTVGHVAPHHVATDSEATRTTRAR
jgi:3-(3-hydroxy-phenyl)propionate hydroxylase